MDTRNRYLAVLNFRSVDRTLKWEGGYLAKTVRRWYGEGLRRIKGIPNSLRSGSGVYGENQYDLISYFDLDPRGYDPPGFTTAFSSGDSPGLLFPPFEPQIIEDYGEWVIRRTTMGTVVRDRKDKMTLPFFISGPVQERSDWEQLKDERLQPRLVERFPENWDEMTRLFRDLFRFAYRKIVSISKENGALVSIETDGDCRLLIPFFIEVGIDIILPFECTNGQNIVEIRRQWPRLVIMGGIDKKALIKGKKGIDEELESKVPYMLQHGGYIPFIDHNIPPEVSFKTYSYYRQKLNEIIVKTGRK